MCGALKGELSHEGSCSEHVSSLVLDQVDKLRTEQEGSAPDSLVSPAWKCQECLVVSVPA